MPYENFQITGVIYYCENLSDNITISEEDDGYQWINIEDIGEVFTREAFVERMKSWNWESVMDNNITFRYDVE